MLITVPTSTTTAKGFLVIFTLEEIANETARHHTTARDADARGRIRRPSRIADAHRLPARPRGSRHLRAV